MSSSSLIQAIAIDKPSDYRAKVEQVLATEANLIDKPNEDGFTALHMACMRGDKELVARLLRQGAKLNNSNSGTTPLHVASVFGYSQIVTMLLAHLSSKPELIALLEAKDRVFGNTALHYATLKGSTKIATILLDNGANPNSINFLGHSILNYAANYCMQLVTPLITNYKADTSYAFAQANMASIVKTQQAIAGNFTQQLSFAPIVTATALQHNQAWLSLTPNLVQDMLINLQDCLGIPELAVRSTARRAKRGFFIMFGREIIQPDRDSFTSKIISLSSGAPALRIFVDLGNRLIVHSMEEKEIKPNHFSLLTSSSKSVYVSVKARELLSKNIYLEKQLQQVLAVEKRRTAERRDKRLYHIQREERIAHKKKSSKNRVTKVTQPA